MGRKSTVNISREEALEKIQLFLQYADNTTIEDVLERLNDHIEVMELECYLGPHNFCIQGDI